LAGDGGAGEGGVLQPGASCGAVVCVGFHAHEEPGRDDRRQPFDHLVYHWVLTYSNWEIDHDLFFGEFRESQRGVSERRVAVGWRSPAAPHGSDEPGGETCLQRKEFTGRYTGLLGYYGIEMEKIQPEEPNENGDAEQSAPPVQGGRGASPAAAWQPGLRES